MKDSIRHQLEALRDIRLQISILFGFIGIIFSVILTKGNFLEYSSIFSIMLTLAFTFVCLAFIISTYGLEKDLKINNDFLKKLNVLIRASVITLFFAFLSFILKSWGWTL
jgi:hypothetical protein